MKLPPLWLPALRRSESAFTMVEIALALAVIGFSIVAIVGVLPTGLGVQRENREETIINQDAAYWMEAIRNGARGLDDLTNYVDAITNVITVYNPAGAIVSVNTNGYTRLEYVINNVLAPPADVNANILINGYRIIGLLSTPTYIPAPINPGGFITNNRVTAFVRALSGAATEKAPQDNPDTKQLAFSYRLTPEVVPYSNWDTNWVDYGASNLPPAEIIARSNYWQVAKTLNTDLRDVRLAFRWPVLPNGNFGAGRQIFRTMVSGTITNEPLNGPWYFFESRSYARTP